MPKSTTNSSLHSTNPPYKLFWGGLDLDPSFYYTPRSKYCGGSDILDDDRILKNMKDTIKAGIPVIGICRSAQALNVVNGGVLAQHIDNHCQGHQIKLEYKDMDTLYCNVSSTHHQMMIPTSDAVFLGECLEPTTGVHWKNVDEPHKYNKVTEVIYYPKTKSLCIQPHPEWMPQDSSFVEWINLFIQKELKCPPINFDHEYRNQYRY